MQNRSPILLPLVIFVAAASSACGGGDSGGVDANPPPVAGDPTPVAAAITVQPTDQSVALGQTASFSVVASGTGTLTYQWQKDGIAIPGANSAQYVTPAVTMADAGARFAVVVSNSLGSVTSAAASLSVAAIVSGVDVLTYHANNMRTGLYANESSLTPTNVNMMSFGKLGMLATDGKVDAQPLVVSGLTIAGQGTHDVVYVATEHGSVYAFDATSRALLWKVTLIPGAETPSDARGCSQVIPEIGVTATPVIDRTRGAHGIIYVVAMSKNGTQYFQRLHALDLATGAELLGGPVSVQATFPGTGANASNGSVVFDPAQYEERAALLLLNGLIYTTWTSHCDNSPYTGWIIAYDGATLARSSVLNVTPNGGLGAIWMAGGGPAADASGNFFLLDGNGTFDTTLDSAGFPSQRNFGNAFLKISTASGLAVADYFATSNTVALSNADQDLGSGATLVLPDLMDGSNQVWHLAVGAGKNGVIYVVNRDSMGKFDPTKNNAVQELSGVLSGRVFSGPAYFNNMVYYGAVDDHIKAISIVSARLAATAASQSPSAFAYPGTTPSISSLGTSNAIVWAVENANSAVLHAYESLDLSHEIYNSNQNVAGRDHFGAGNKFITPVIANGHVYVGTPSGVAVFGLSP